MADIINVSEILSEFGNYQKRGQSKKDIMTALLKKTELDEYMTRRTTEDNIIELSTAEITSIVQTYQKGWTPRGGVTFAPIKKELGHFKVDITLDPYVIVDTWLDFLRDNQLDPAKFPLTKWIIEELIIPKMNEEMEMEAAFKGVKGVLSAGTAQPVGESFDGLKEQILDAIDAGTANRVLTTGDAISDANILDRLEDFEDALPEEFEGIPMIYMMSKTLEKWYLRNKKAEGVYTIGSDADLNKEVDFSLNKVKGLNAMSGSKMVFITPKWNLVSSVRTGPKVGKFEMQSNKREVDVFGDFYKAWFIIDPTYVYAYVPDDEMHSSGSGSGS